MPAAVVMVLPTGTKKRPRHAGDSLLFLQTREELLLRLQNQERRSPTMGTSSPGSSHVVWFGLDRWIGVVQGLSSIGLELPPGVKRPELWAIEQVHSNSETVEGQARAR